MPQEEASALGNKNLPWSGAQRPRNRNNKKDLLGIPAKGLNQKVLA